MHSYTENLVQDTASAFFTMRIFCVRFQKQNDGNEKGMNDAAN